MDDNPYKINPSHYHIDHYADNEVTEFHDTPVPTFLKYVYVITPIWGVIWFFLYWNGSHGWLDRGYWKELQSAANTKFEVESGQQKDAVPKS